MRGDNCPYCGMVYPHKSMAAQHADVANQMMGQMMAQQAQQQNQWRAAMGVPPIGGAPPYAGPPGAYPGPHPYHAVVQHHMVQAQQTARGFHMVALAISLGAVLLVVGISVLVMFL